MEAFVPPQLQLAACDTKLRFLDVCRDLRMICKSEEQLGEHTGGSKSN